MVRARRHLVHLESSSWERTCSSGGHMSVGAVSNDVQPPATLPTCDLGGPLRLAIQVRPATRLSRTIPTLRCHRLPDLRNCRLQCRLWVAIDGDPGCEDAA